MDFVEGSEVSFGGKHVAPLMSQPAPLYIPFIDYYNLQTQKITWQNQKQTK